MASAPPKLFQKFTQGKASLYLKQAMLMSCTRRPRAFLLPLMIMVNVMTTMAVVVLHETSQDICAALENSPRHAGYLSSDIHSVFLQARLRLHANDDHDENRLVSSPQKPYSIIKSGILCVRTSWHLKGGLCPFSNRQTARWYQKLIRRENMGGGGSRVELIEGALRKQLVRAARRHDDT